jgi:F0F1-type ATP synthase membrane subunit b/b'
MIGIIQSFLGTMLAFIVVLFLINHFYGDRLQKIYNKFATIEKLLNRFL